MTNFNNETLVMMGRLEGKVDTLITMQASVSSRVDTLEERMTKGEVDVAALRSSITSKSSTSHNFLNFFLSIVATIIAALSAFYGVFK